MGSLDIIRSAEYASSVGETLGQWDPLWPLVAG